MKIYKGQQTGGHEGISGGSGSSSELSLDVNFFKKKKKTYLDTIQGHMCMRRVRGEKLFL